MLFNCIARILDGMYLMVANYIFFAKKTHSLASLTIINGIINIILLIIFIKSYGLMGVVIAQVITKIIQFICTWYIANKSVQMPWNLLKHTK